MKMMHGKEQVVMIEYHNDKPFSVTTVHDGRCKEYDVEVKKDGCLLFSNSAYFGYKDLSAPALVIEEQRKIQKLWVSSKIKDLDISEHNVVKNPILVTDGFNSSTNPLEIGEECGWISFCENEKDFVSECIFSESDEELIKNKYCKKCDRNPLNF